MIRRILILFIACALLTSRGSADLVINVSDTAGGVEFSWSGSLDLSGLFYLGESTFGEQVDPMGSSIGAPFLGYDGSTSLATYVQIGGVAAQPPFGSGGAVTATPSVSGSPFVLLANPSITVGVPSGYSSGDPLVGSSTWPGTTVAGLGVLPSTSYNVGSSTITFQTVSVIPEASGVAVLGAGLATGLLFHRRRRRKLG